MQIWPADTLQIGPERGEGGGQIFAAAEQIIADFLDKFSNGLRGEGGREGMTNSSRCFLKS